MNKLFIHLSLISIFSSSLCQALPSATEGLLNNVSEKVYAAPAAASSFVAQASNSVLTTLDKALFAGLSKLQFSVTINPGSTYQFIKDSPFKSLLFITPFLYLYYRYNSSIPYLKKCLIEELKKNNGAAGWGNTTNIEELAYKIGGQSFTELIKKHKYSLTTEVHDYILQNNIIPAFAVWRV